ncbi:hypothetical protein HDV06_000676 [Boothiomyces sp. JEL0866]|nr:hypothetical protein HDV06_000676 [Boothiomyces sp. JEL0866]
MVTKYTIDKVEIELELPKGPDIWKRLWSCSFVLSKILLKLPPFNTTLELGAGLGIPSLFGSKSTETEYIITDVNDECVSLLSENIKLNGLLNAKALKLDWTKETLVKADLVIASEILYSYRMVRPLVEIISKLLDRDGVALVVDPGRQYFTDFQDLLVETGFLVELIEAKNVQTQAGVLINCFVAVISYTTQPDLVEIIKAVVLPLEIKDYKGQYAYCE